MNVAFDQWIPVVTVTGERKLISLCEVFTDGEQIADLIVRPHERVALMRLFLCVAHAAIQGPKDYESWLALPGILPERVLAYLKNWKDSFELFHPEKPWLQVTNLSKSSKRACNPNITNDWTPISKLNFSYATGNNTTLFDHAAMSGNRKIAIEETVVSMLTFQCFSPGGLISQVYWNGIQSGKSSKDGTCVPVSMIHAFLRNRTLVETILLNLPTEDDIKFSYGERDIGKPIWEMMPSSYSDTKNITNAIATYMGRLVPLSRLILLHPSCDQMLLGDGLPYPTFADGFPQEPSASVVIRRNKYNEERALLSYHPAKAIWRELAALLVKRKAEGAGGPLSLRSIQDGQDCDLIVTALARDQATIVNTIESVYHIPYMLRTTEGIATYESEVKITEEWSRLLGWAVEQYRGEIDGGWEGRLKGAGPRKKKLKEQLHSIATVHYWTSVEKKLHLLIDHIEALGTDRALPIRKSWRKELLSSAQEAYITACGRTTARQMRAFTKGWQKLAFYKNSYVSDISEEKKEKE